MGYDKGAKLHSPAGLESVNPLGKRRNKRTGPGIRYQARTLGERQLARSKLARRAALWELRRHSVQDRKRLDLSSHSPSRPDIQLADHTQGLQLLLRFSPTVG